MSTRYLTNIAIALGAGFLVVASQAFAPATMTWLMLGIGAGSLAILVPATAIRRRGVVQRGLDVVIGIVAIWTIVSGLVFAGATVTWLGFASGVALVALAVIGLTAHELSTERVVHSLKVHAAGEPELKRDLQGVTS